MHAAWRMELTQHGSTCTTKLHPVKEHTGTVRCSTSLVLLLKPLLRPGYFLEPKRVGILQVLLRF